MAKKKREQPESTGLVQVAFRLPKQLWDRFQAVVDAMPFQPAYVNVVKALIEKFVDEEEKKGGK